VGRLHKCPAGTCCRSCVPFALLLGVADPLALDAESAVEANSPTPRKSGDLPDLQCDGHGQDRPDAIDRLEHDRNSGEEPQALEQHLLEPFKSVPSAHRWRPGHSNLKATSGSLSSGQVSKPSPLSVALFRRTRSNADLVLNRGHQRAAVLDEPHTLPSHVPKAAPGLRIDIPGRQDPQAHQVRKPERIVLVVTVLESLYCCTAAVFTNRTS